MRMPNIAANVAAGARKVVVGHHAGHGASPVYPQPDLSGGKVTINPAKHFELEELRKIIHELKTGTTVNGLPIVDSKLQAFAVKVGRVLIQAVTLQDDDVEGEERLEGIVNDMVGSLNDFLSGIGVIATLTLSIAIPSLVSAVGSTDIVTEDSFYRFFLEEKHLEALNIVYVALVAGSATASVISTIYSLLLYIWLNTCMPDWHSKLWFVRTQKIVVPEVMLVVALLTLMAAIPFAMLVVYGDLVCIICLIVSAVGILVYMVLNYMLLSTCTSHLAPKFRKAGQDLDDKLRQYEAGAAPLTQISANPAVAEPQMTQPVIHHGPF